MEHFTKALYVGRKSKDNEENRLISRSCLIKLSQGEIYHFILQYIHNFLHFKYDIIITITPRGLLYSPLDGVAAAWYVMNDKVVLNDSVNIDENIMKFDNIVLITGVTFDLYQVLIEIYVII